MGSRTAHLSDEQLSRFEDRALSPREGAHLESCSHCRGRLRDLQTATVAYSEYWESVHRPLLPPAPKAWKSLDALIAQHETRSSPKVLRWRLAIALVGAFCIGIAVMVLYRPDEKASIRATELLTQSSKLALPEGRRISLRARGRTLIRPAVLMTDIMEGEPERARLQALFVISIHPQVSSILVFGSVALQQVDEYSDVDILVICRSDVLPLADRRRILSALSTNWIFQDPSNENCLFAEVDANGVVEGIHVTIHYQVVPWISDVLCQVLEEGAVTTEKLPFRPYTLPALIRRAWVLRDNDGTVANWRHKARIFPELLRRNIIRHFTPLLQESVLELTTNAERCLGPRLFIFWLDRAVDALISILFAVNEFYDPAERRTERIILPKLARVPPDFLSVLSDVMVGPFDDDGARLRARKFAGLSAQVLELSQIS